MYTVEGMSCGGCVAAVQTALKAMPDVIDARVQLTGPQAIVSMQTDLPAETLQEALSGHGGYRIREYREPGASGKEEKPRKAAKLLGFLLPKKDCCK